MFSNLWKVIVTIIIGISLVTSSPVMAAAKDLSKQADKIIRKAERKMHSGKNEEAETMLKEADRLLQQGESEEPGNKNISQIRKKYERINKAVNKKLGKQVVTTSSKGSRLPKKPKPKAMSSNSSTGVDRSQEGNQLPNNVKSALKKVEVNLNNVESYFSQGKAAKTIKYELSNVEELFKMIDHRYSGKFDPEHADFVAAKERYNRFIAKADSLAESEVKAEANAAIAKETREKQSAEWIPKFQQYLSYQSSEGHNPAKLVYVPGTSEPEKFEDAKKRYEEFKAFYQQYQNTEFPYGKTWALENLADNEAPARLKDFEKGFASRMGSVAQSAEGEIVAAMAYLDKDNGWKSDKSIRPNLLDHKRMDSIREATAQAVTALGANSTKAKQLQTSFNQLLAKDKENRQIRKERTFMIADVYKGDDIDALKKKANSLVKNNQKEGGEPLRCTVIAENWRQETVEEWTDTSRTQRRIRTTRHQTAQVAAKMSSGVRLITVALAQDKQSNGNWGPLYGNLHQGSDPMLESNVEK